MVRFKGVKELNDEQLSLYIIIILELCTAIVALCTGARLQYFHITSSCKGFEFLGVTLLFIGVALLSLFLITALLARTPNPVILKSLFCSVPLVLVLLALGIFVLAVSSQGGGRTVPGGSHEVYVVDSYSKWMQNRVEENWEKYYKKVVVENKGHFCNKEGDSILKYGCCQPPEECSFNYNTKPQVKEMQENNYHNYSNDVDDCNNWDDDPNILCFDCESCKASFLQDVTGHWFTTGVGLVVAAGIPLSMGLIWYVTLVISGGVSSLLHQPLNNGV